jgi:hypothetical protein
VRLATDEKVRHDAAMRVRVNTTVWTPKGTLRRSGFPASLNHPLDEALLRASMAGYFV